MSLTTHNLVAITMAYSQPCPCTRGTNASVRVTTSEQTTGQNRFSTIKFQ